MRILFCDTSFPAARATLGRYLPDDEIVCCPQSELADHIGAAEVAIPLMARLDAELLENAGRLRLIHQFGVGLEGVDIEAARRRGIAVANVPSGDTGNSVSVAEWVLFLMLALARDFPSAASAVRERRLGVPVGTVLFGKRAGVVGLGNLGRAISARLKALGMEVWAVRRTPAPTPPEDLDFLGGPGDLGALLEAVDFLILAVPLTPQTRGLIGRRELARMKPTAFLINVSRGPVVDYDALLEALENRRIAGAGLDVFWTEPPDPEDPLFRHNVIASPHIAGVTDFSYDLIAKAVADNVERLRSGRPLRHLAWS
ncbi:2-hydroxyacid dehydrogenase [Deferrisoma sp.]